MNDNNKNLALARFITSFGSMNNYKSSVLQTKRVLDNEVGAKLPKNDTAILYDALDGISAIEDKGFNSDGIIAVNKAFTYSENEDPQLPGHLRNAFYNPDDAIMIVTDPNGTSRGAYSAPDIVEEKDLDNIVTEFNNSKKTRRDGWKVFAKISKLQPFQDGNKRTALIAANAAMNTWDKQNYLVLPFNNIDHAEFMVNLMRFYVAETDVDEEKALDKIMTTLPSEKEVNLHLPLTKEEKENPLNLKTKRIKSFYSNKLSNSPFGHDLER